MKMCIVIVLILIVTSSVWVFAEDAPRVYKESSESTSFHKWIDKEGNIHFSGTIGEKAYKGSDSSRERLYANKDDEKKCANFKDFKKYKDDPAYQKLLCERYNITLIFMNKTYPT